MLSDLIAFLDSEEFADEGRISLTSFDVRESVLDLDLALTIGSEGKPRERWRLLCHGPRRYRIEDTTSRSLEVWKEHPLLVPHVSRHGTLYFKGRPSSRGRTFIRLWTDHHRITEGWYPFETFLNPKMPLLDLLGTGSGMLAEGPVPFMMAYAKSIEVYGVRCTLVGEKDPERWDGEKWVSEPRGLQAIVMGKSFVIAQRFEGIRRT